MYTVYVHGKVEAGSYTANDLRPRTQPMSKQCVRIRMSELIFHKLNNSVENSASRAEEDGSTTE